MIEIEFEPMGSRDSGVTSIAWGVSPRNDGKKNIEPRSGGLTTAPPERRLLLIAASRLPAACFCVPEMPGSSDRPRLWVCRPVPGSNPASGVGV